ncbi:hypothetical protein V1515DRAFT_611657 [Lipomyces mesembrius]
MNAASIFAPTLRLLRCATQACNSRTSPENGRNHDFPEIMHSETILMAIDFIAGGLAFASKNNRSIALGIAVLSFLFNVVWTGSFYALSMVIPSEVATVRLRNHTMSYTVAWCQITAVITTFAVPQITSAGAGNLGPKAYLVFGGCMACILTFTFFMIPESKGLTFPQIDETYEKGIPAWRWNSERAYLKKVEEEKGLSKE